MKRIKNIEFNMVKENAKTVLSGNWLMFSLCLIFSVIIFMMLLPTRYIYALLNMQVELTVTDMLWVFIATAVSETLIFVLTCAMYSIIFYRQEGEKKGVGLILRRANILFPSTIPPILLTKVSFSLLTFLLSPVVSAKLYDYLLLTVISYRVYVILLAVISLIVSIASYVVMIMYIFTPCVIADKPEISGIEAMKISRKLIKGRKMNMLWFIISFAVWYMLGMMFFGLGMMWAHAYMLTSVYIYYRKCMKGE